MIFQFFQTVKLQLILIRFFIMYKIIMIKNTIILFLEDKEKTILITINLIKNKAKNDKKF